LQWISFLIQGFSEAFVHEAAQSRLKRTLRNLGLSKKIGMESRLRRSKKIYYRLIEGAKMKVWVHCYFFAGKCRKKQFIES